MKILLIILLILFLQLTTLLFADWGNEEKVIPYDGSAEDWFGISVSISGDYAVVGAYDDDDNGYDSGSAYIFQRIGTGWSQQEKLTASDATAYSRFGCSVSISGDYAVVGAYGDDDNGFASGSSYIFYRSGTSWSQQEKLTASDATAFVRFGCSVSISGDYAVVGAHYDDDNGPSSGSAYIFQRIGTGWSQQVKLTASDAAAGDNFGHSVSISGDYAVVGAWGDNDNGELSGSAYIFHRSGTSWSQQEKLTASDATAYDHFGWLVSISGDYIVIGADGDDDNGPSSGSAYIFQRNGTSWSQQVKLTTSDGADGDHFGCSVSISDDYAIIGAYCDDDNGPSSGSAYIFQRNGTSWSQEDKLIASDGAIDDTFGYSVSISEDYAVVGAHGDDDNGYFSGSAYFFENLNTTVSPSSVQRIGYAELKSAYPNPFNPTTTISFSVPQTSSFANLEIYNIRGQKVKIFPVILSGDEGRGENKFSVVWNGTDQNNQPVSSGIYLYKLNVDGKTEAFKKCLLLK